MTSNPHALTGAWILGALDRAEHAEFEAHLDGAGCPFDPAEPTLFGSDASRATDAAGTVGA